jgi:hypothetical protein
VIAIRSPIRTTPAARSPPARPAVIESGERSKVLRGFVNFIGLRMISPPDYSPAPNRHALIFNAKASDQNAHTYDETPSSVAGANHALDQRRSHFHHDRQRMEDL